MCKLYTVNFFVSVIDVLLSLYVLRRSVSVFELDKGVATLKANKYELPFTLFHCLLWYIILILSLNEENSHALFCLISSLNG